ncbi:hypothetical protein GCM10027091_16230 [Streptomyces daliensis]
MLNQWREVSRRTAGFPGARGTDQRFGTVERRREPPRDARGRIRTVPDVREHGANPPLPAGRPPRRDPRPDPRRGVRAGPSPGAFRLAGPFLSEFTDSPQAALSTAVHAETYA